MQGFLSAFPKFFRAIISFVISVYLPFPPSVCMEQLGFHWADFLEI
jgi:hypothetical protein